MVSARIFGIGLSRTGTTSLHAAAVLLGFPAIHYPLPLVQKWVAGNFSSSSMGPFEFYSDLPVPVYFREFDRVCPGSKFILTTRDAAEWIDGVERWFAKMPPSSSETGQRDVVRLVSYGVHNFHRQRFLDVFHRHTDEVMAYFQKRPEDLLVLDLTTESEPWERLCNFVGRAVPSQKFPHLKTPAIGNLQYVLDSELVDKQQRMVRLLKEGN